MTHVFCQGSKQQILYLLRVNRQTWANSVDPDEMLQNEDALLKGIIPDNMTERLLKLVMLNK